MLHPADFIFNHDRLVLLDDEPSRSHKNTGLQLLIFLAASLEGQMGDCNLDQFKLSLPR